MNISIKEMIKSGIHFGHQTRYWHPKMKQYIYKKYNNIHIINLEKTLILLKLALKKINILQKKKKKILFVGTKKIASSLTKKIACKYKQFFVNHRWLGGMLTNWKTVKKSIKNLKKLEKQEKNGIFNKLVKKEALYKKKLLIKLENSIGGIKNMEKLPDALFVIDAKYEKIAIKEAQKLKIKIFAIVDTNTNPEGIDYIIPGNDDSKKSIKWYINILSKNLIENIKKKN